MGRGRDDERVDERRWPGEAARPDAFREADRREDPATLEIHELPRGHAPVLDDADSRADARDDRSDRRYERRLSVPVTRLILPDGPRREAVTLEGRTVRLKGSETRLLATVGAFRVIREDDVAVDPTDRYALRGDLRHMAIERLVDHRTVVIENDATRIIVLTAAGQTLLETHRDPRPGEPEQIYYAGLVRRRDLPHDTELYRMYQANVRPIEADGGRITRVVLEAELRRDYLAFLHRQPEPDRDDPERFAEATDLRVVDGQVRLPDLRIEYDQGGRLAHRDLEWVSRHYSGATRATKGQAGFRLYQGHGARRGSVPYDPGHARRLS